MSQKERNIKSIMDMVKAKQITLKKAGEQLDLSYSHMKKIKKKYFKDGDKALVHKARGVPKRSRRHPRRAEILEIYKNDYFDFGPTLASEKLKERNGIDINAETLRRTLLAEGLITRKRKRKEHRQRRERREQFGELLQIDGSIHDWFEEGKHSCMINIVDDATGIAESFIDTGETTFSVMMAFKYWFQKYGIPLAIYVDLKNVYVSSKSEEGGMSQIQKLCASLGIKIVRAYSAQAKGRVERKHQVFQDRFVKELRLQKLKTIQQANDLLQSSFVDFLNNKFKKEPANKTSAHRAFNEVKHGKYMATQEERVINNDWTFTLNKEIYQIPKSFERIIKPKDRITILEGIDGVTRGMFEGIDIEIRKIEARPVKTAQPLVKQKKLSRSECGRLGKAASPWRNTPDGWISSSNSNYKKWQYS